MMFNEALHDVCYRNLDMNRSIQFVYRSPMSVQCGINHQPSTVVPGGDLAKSCEPYAPAFMQDDWRVIGETTPYSCVPVLWESVAPFAASVNGGKSNLL